MSVFRPESVSYWCSSLCASRSSLIDGTLNAKSSRSFSASPPTDGDSGWPWNKPCDVWRHDPVWAEKPENFEITQLASKWLSSNEMKSNFAAPKSNYTISRSCQGHAACKITSHDLIFRQLVEIKWKQFMQEISYTRHIYLFIIYNICVNKKIDIKHYYAYNNCTTINLWRNTVVKNMQYNLPFNDAQYK